MRTDRLLAIIHYLLAHGVASAAVLASHFEVSKRTIQRDMQTLSLAGIPITTQTGRQGGYRIMEGFVLDKKLLQQTDFSRMETALQGLETATGSKAIAGTRLRLLEGGQQAPLRIAMDLSATREGEGMDEKLALLEDAVEDNMVVTLLYIDSKGGVTERDVEPLELILQWNAWYLHAYCRMREDYRLFKVERIEEMDVTGELFDLHDAHLGMLAEGWDGGSQTILDITLRCKAKAQRPICEYLNGEIAHTYENGDFLYHMALPEGERMWFSLLLGFGDEIEVLKPEDLRHQLIQTAKNILAQYEDK